MMLAGLGKVAFSGHETFPFRYTWLPKAVAEVRKDGEVFSADDALVRFGVGKNMVKSIRHWSLATGVLEAAPQSRGQQLEVSSFGKRLFGKAGWDPYLEDPATLWLLHWRLASARERATTWYWVFNHCPQPEFTKNELLGWLLSVAEQSGSSRASEASLRRDIDVFLGTYVPTRPTRTTPIEDALDCPLVELELLREFGNKGSYVLHRGDHPSLPDAVFAFALGEFLQRMAHASKTVGLDEIAFAAGAPGRVFCLSEDALLARVERLGRATGGAIRFDDTAGLRQLLLADLPDPLSYLDAHFGRTDGEELH